MEDVVERQREGKVGRKPTGRAIRRVNVWVSDEQWRAIRKALTARGLTAAGVARDALLAVAELPLGVDRPDEDEP